MACWGKTKRSERGEELKEEDEGKWAGRARMTPPLPVPLFMDHVGSWGRSWDQATPHDPAVTASANKDAPRSSYGAMTARPRAADPAAGCDGPQPATCLACAGSWPEVVAAPTSGACAPPGAPSARQSRLVHPALDDVAPAGSRPSPTRTRPLTPAGAAGSSFPFGHRQKRSPQPAGPVTLPVRPKVSLASARASR